MKKALHTGGANALNIYTVGLIKDDANGPGRAGLNKYIVALIPSDQRIWLRYAIYPSSYSTNPKDDGVVMLYSAAPGSPLGKVLSHEVGHWAGLYHTFEGGCSGPGKRSIRFAQPGFPDNFERHAGDYVDDTPPEASPSRDCLVGHDTCPGGGVDSVHNM
ncbi:hypothetical protein FRC12_019069 [Ceratobasidium sp. 428]|nr:hypothetical protein FRC12_019069 [Ceratobasidium sp. 428]